ncbi:MAG: FAD-dependent oxidoreductase, partial [Alphaproteobacteria bacterium]|nr:FAD-dependent oxidoreductase [Alphaproteobacteria bacterium]
MELKANVVGAGLAGAEAAWQLAQRNINVTLYEMKPLKRSPAHKTDLFAELVCSNSFRSDDYVNNAVGLLHEEMRRVDSLIIKAADETKVPAGGALAV